MTSEVTWRKELAGEQIDDSQKTIVKRQKSKVPELKKERKVVGGIPYDQRRPKED